MKEFLEAGSAICLAMYVLDQLVAWDIERSTRPKGYRYTFTVRLSDEQIDRLRIVEKPEEL